MIVDLPHWLKGSIDYPSFTIPTLDKRAGFPSSEYAGIHLIDHQQYQPEYYHGEPTSITTSSSDEHFVVDFNINLNTILGE
jgi:hypothetical protein